MNDPDLSRLVERELPQSMNEETILLDEIHDQATEYLYYAQSLERAGRIAWREGNHQLTARYAQAARSFRAHLQQDRPPNAAS